MSDGEESKHEGSAYARSAPATASVRDTGEVAVDPERSLRDAGAGRPQRVRITPAQAGHNAHQQVFRIRLRPVNDGLEARGRTSAVEIADRLHSKDIAARGDVRIEGRQGGQIGNDAFAQEPRSRRSG